MQEPNTNHILTYKEVLVRKPNKSPEDARIS